MKKCPLHLSVYHRTKKSARKSPHTQRWNFNIKVSLSALFPSSNSALQPEIARKLQELGVKVETLTVPMTLDVETYTVDFYKEEYSLFEKFYPVKVKTTVNTKQVFFPAGTFVVPMNQKNGNVAASVLEPEAANGFINYRIYETKQGEELPVYRKMNSDK